MFNSKKTKPEIVRTPEELLSTLPKWSIKDKRPSKFWNKGKEFIQVVLLSKITGQKTFWAEWDGIGLIRTGNRAYKVPKENIYGDVFVWDIDKKQSLTEIIKVDNDDAEDSFHELQMFNMAYSVGRQAGANDLLNKLGTVMIILILIALVEIGIGYLVYSRTGAILEQFANIKSMLEVMKP